MNKRAIGADGENQAAEYLLGSGYEILERNFICKLGEIDIIARKDKTVVFVEVKWRRDDKKGMPGESVSHGKQMTIMRCAMLYAQKHSIYEKPMRFDVIEIIQDKLNHIENAFMMQTNPRYL